MKIVNKSNNMGKMISQSGKILLSALILIQSMVFSIPIVDAVLCFGDDGHIMLEQQGSDIHCQHPSVPSLPEELSGTDFHSDDCVDIPLEQHVLKAYIKHIDPNKLVYKAPVFFTNSNNLPNPYAVNSIKNLQFRYPQSSLNALKSIVLII